MFCYCNHTSHFSPFKWIQKSSSFTMVFTRAVCSVIRIIKAQTRNLKRSITVQYINGKETTSSRRIDESLFSNNHKLQFFPSAIFVKEKIKIGYKYVCLETYSYGITGFHAFMHRLYRESTSPQTYWNLNNFCLENAGCGVQWQYIKWRQTFFYFGFSERRI